MMARPKPAAGGEVHGPPGPCGGIQQGVVPSAVHPGAPHNEVVGFAIGRHQGEHLARALQPDARPSCGRAQQSKFAEHVSCSHT